MRADELRQVKELLWTTISSRLPPSELEMVKLVIGTAKIDRNEQVFQEVSALSEILGEVRISTDVEFNRRRVLVRAGRSFWPLSASLLTLGSCTRSLDCCRALPCRPASRYQGGTMGRR